jgi:hypothetical protein
MKSYEVKINELMYHSLMVEAESSDDALDKAYELLRNGMSKDQQKEFDYSLESEGFTGEHDVEEW